MSGAIIMNMCEVIKSQIGKYITRNIMELSQFLLSGTTIYNIGVELAYQISLFKHHLQ